MDTLQATYRDDDDDTNASPSPPPTTAVLDGGARATNFTAADLITGEKPELPENNHGNELNEEVEAPASEYVSSEEADQIDHITPNPPPEVDGNEEGEEEEEEEEAPTSKKQKPLSDLPKPTTDAHESTETPSPADAISPPPENEKPPAVKTGKKSKKKNKDVWSTTSRKGKKKTKHASNSNHKSNGGAPSTEDKVLITPIPKFPDRNDDSPELTICLSRVYKAEKVELSEDRLTASSTKGYRMVRATRGVSEGAWYFEIKAVQLGETGHTRLGWSTEKGDLQAPVGYDGNSYGYRDIDGSKMHKALREKYGEEGYGEGDIIGFYINLPEGGLYAPNPPRLVWHKGQRYICAPNAKEDSLKVVPGSEILYFKNGICQGVAFSDLYGGRYYPAASMYTLPNQPACVVKFNFGPDFESFPQDFGDRAVPRPMIEVPYQSYEDRLENGNPWNIPRMSPMFKVMKEENRKIAEAAEMVG